MATVLITGGAGFLGSRVAKAILEQGTLHFNEGKDPKGEDRPVGKLLLLDPFPPQEPLAGAIYVTGDLLDKVLLDSILTTDVSSIFHFAAVLSGEAERNPAASMRVNVDGTRALLERCRELGHRPRFVLASSVAVFAAPPAAMTDRTTGAPRFADSLAPLPRSTYGTHKAIAELLLSDATRRGCVDGRCLRLPTIAVRPGVSKATSSFASAIIRDPLHGQSAICPVSPNLPLWIQSPRAVVKNLLHGHGLPAASLPSAIITLPGLTVTPAEIVKSLEDAGADTSLVRWERDDLVDRVVSSWPGSIDTPYADSLGFVPDSDVWSIIATYMEDDMGRVHPLK